MEAVEAKPGICNALEVRGLDRPAKRTARSEANVVRQDQQDVRRSFGASTPFGKSGFESFTVRPITP